MKKIIFSAKLLFGAIFILSIGLYLKPYQKNEPKKYSSLEISNDATPLSPEPYEIVGELIGGNPVITVNTSNLIATYNQRLSEESGISGNFTSVTLASYPNELGYYLLTFSGPLYSSTLLGYEHQVGDDIMIAIETKTSCTTKECVEEALGCSPKLGGGCWACANEGECTKTVTTTSMFYNY